MLSLDLKSIHKRFLCLAYSTESLRHAFQIPRSTWTLLWCLLREMPILQASFAGCREIALHVIFTWGRPCSFCDHLKFAIISWEAVHPLRGNLQDSCWENLHPMFTAVPSWIVINEKRAGSKENKLRSKGLLLPLFQGKIDGYSGWVRLPLRGKRR